MRRGLFFYKFVKKYQKITHNVTTFRFSKWSAIRIFKNNKNSLKLLFFYFVLESSWLLFASVYFWKKKNYLLDNKKYIEFGWNLLNIN